MRRQWSTSTPPKLTLAVALAFLKQTNGIERLACAFRNSSSGSQPHATGAKGRTWLYVPFTILGLVGRRD
jgi:hypothetical protein